MNKNELLNKIEIEDYIWIINIFIVIFALISNYYEKDYIKNNTAESKKIYKTINIIILIILFFIYAYLAYSRAIKVTNNKNTSFNKEVLIDEANFIAATLILIGALIYLIDEIIDTNINDLNLDLL